MEAEEHPEDYQDKRENKDRSEVAVAKKLPMQVPYFELSELVVS